MSPCPWCGMQSPGDLCPWCQRPKQQRSLYFAPEDDVARERRSDISRLLVGLLLGVLVVLAVLFGLRTTNATESTLPASMTASHGDLLSDRNFDALTSNGLPSRAPTTPSVSNNRVPVRSPSSGDHLQVLNRQQRVVSDAGVPVALGDPVVDVRLESARLSEEYDSRGHPVVYALVSLKNNSRVNVIGYQVSLDVDGEGMALQRSDWTPSQIPAGSGATGRFRLPREIAKGVPITVRVRAALSGSPWFVVHSFPLQKGNAEAAFP